MTKAELIAIKKELGINYKTKPEPKENMEEEKIVYKSIEEQRKEREEQELKEYEEYIQKIDSDYDKNEVGIYQWKNLKENKIYIGQSKKLTERKKHFLKFLRDYGGTKINDARRKYNDEKYWEYTVIEYCKPSELNDKEISYIEELESYDDKIGYNKITEHVLETQLRMIQSRPTNSKTREKYNIAENIKQRQLQAIRNRLKIFDQCRSVLYDKCATDKLKDLNQYLKSIIPTLDELETKTIDNNKWKKIKYDIEDKMERIAGKYNKNINYYNRQFTIKEAKKIINENTTSDKIT